MLKSYRVTVVDGATPLLEGVDTEPTLQVAARDVPVLDALMSREPLFHRAGLGTTRTDFERMAAREFWEVGASGRGYSRDYVLDSLVRRYRNPTFETWEVDGFHCLEITADHYLVTYTLAQGQRITRRATLWRRVDDDWQVVYHQGTIVGAEVQRERPAISTKGP